MLSHSFSFSQSFEIEQVNQFFRPRVKLEDRYYFPAKFKDTTGSFSLNDVQLAVTIPVKTKLHGSLADAFLRKVKRDISLSQHLVSMRFGYKTFDNGYESNSPHHLYNGAAGIIGVKINLKLMATFYSLTVGFAEEDKTIEQFQPRISGIIGQMKLKDINKNYHYGLILTYSDKLFIPIPFFGMEIPLSNKASFLFTLPARAGFNFRPDNKWSLNTYLTFDGFRSGIQYNNVRTNVNYSAAQVAVNARYKIKKWLFVKAEAGYNVRNSISISSENKFPFENTPYIMIGINSNFGESVFNLLD